MKLLAGIGALGLLGGGLYASDALTAGTVYDKPYAKAYADLADMPTTFRWASRTRLAIGCDRGGTQGGLDWLADLSWGQSRSDVLQRN